jgi:hypothetical protein
VTDDWWDEVYAVVLASYHVTPGKLPFLRLMKLYKHARKALRERQQASSATGGASSEDAMWQWALNARNSL